MVSAPSFWFNLFLKGWIFLIKIKNKNIGIMHNAPSQSEETIKKSETFYSSNHSEKSCPQNQKCCRESTQASSKTNQGRITPCGRNESSLGLQDYLRLGEYLKNYKTPFHKLYKNITYDR